MSRKNGNENYKGRRWGRTIAIILLSALVSTTCFTAVAFMTDNFTNKDASTWFTKEKNDANLLSYKKHYIENLLEKTNEGLKVKWKDDGRFTLSGEHKSNSVDNNSCYPYDFASILLTEGDYTITTGNDKCAADEFGLYVKHNGTTTYVYNEPVTFKVTADDTVEIGFFVKNNNFILSEELRPCLVSGIEAAEFFK